MNQNQSYNANHNVSANPNVVDPIRFGSYANPNANISNNSFGNASANVHANSGTNSGGQGQHVSPVPAASFRGDGMIPRASIPTSVQLPATSAAAENDPHKSASVPASGPSSVYAMQLAAQLQQQLHLLQRQQQQLQHGQQQSGVLNRPNNALAAPLPPPPPAPVPPSAPAPPVHNQNQNQNQGVTATSASAGLHFRYDGSHTSLPPPPPAPTAPSSLSSSGPQLPPYPQSSASANQLGSVIAGGFIGQQQQQQQQPQQQQRAENWSVLAQQWGVGAGSGVHPGQHHQHHQPPQPQPGQPGLGGSERRKFTNPLPQPPHSHAQPPPPPRSPLHTTSPTQSSGVNLNANPGNQRTSQHFSYPGLPAGVTFSPNYPDAPSAAAGGGGGNMGGVQTTAAGAGSVGSHASAYHQAQAQASDSGGGGGVGSSSMRRASLPQPQPQPLQGMQQPSSHHPVQNPSTSSAPPPAPSFSAPNTIQSHFQTPNPNPTSTHPNPRTSTPIDPQIQIASERALQPLRLALDSSFSLAFSQVREALQGMYGEYIRLLDIERSKVVSERAKTDLAEAELQAEKERSARLADVVRGVQERREALMRRVRELEGHEAEVRRLRLELAKVAGLATEVGVLRDALKREREWRDKYNRNNNGKGKAPDGAGNTNSNGAGDNDADPDIREISREEFTQIAELKQQVAFLTGLLATSRRATDAYREECRSLMVQKETLEVKVRVWEEGEALHAQVQSQAQAQSQSQGELQSQDESGPVGGGAAEGGASSASSPTSLPQPGHGDEHGRESDAHVSSPQIPRESSSEQNPVLHANSPIATSATVPNLSGSIPATATANVPSPATEPGFQPASPPNPVPPVPASASSPVSSVSASISQMPSMASPASASRLGPMGSQSAAMHPPVTGARPAPITTSTTSPTTTSSTALVSAPAQPPAPALSSAPSTLPPLLSLIPAPNAFSVSSTPYATATDTRSLLIAAITDQVTRAMEGRLRAIAGEIEEQRMGRVRAEERVREIERIRELELEAREREREVRELEMGKEEWARLRGVSEDVGMEMGEEIGEMTRKLTEMSPFYSRLSRDLTPAVAPAEKGSDRSVQDERYIARQSSPEFRSHSLPPARAPSSQPPSRPLSRVASRSASPMMPYSGTSQTLTGPGPDVEEYISSPEVLSRAPPLSRGRLTATSSFSSMYVRDGEGEGPGAGERGRGASASPVLQESRRTTPEVDELAETGSAYESEPDPNTFSPAPLASVTAANPAPLSQAYRPSQQRRVSSSTAATSTPAPTPAPDAEDGDDGVDHDLASRKRTRAEFEVGDVGTEHEEEGQEGEEGEESASAKRPRRQSPPPGAEVRVKVEPDADTAMSSSSFRERLQVKQEPGFKVEAVKKLDTPLDGMQVDGPAAPVQPPPEPAPGPSPTSTRPAARPPSRPPVEAVSAASSRASQASSLEEGEVDTRSEAEKERAKLKRWRRRMRMMMMMRREEEEEEEEEVVVGSGFKGAVDEPELPPPQLPPSVSSPTTTSGRAGPTGGRPAPSLPTHSSSTPRASAQPQPHVSTPTPTPAAFTRRNTPGTSTSSPSAIPWGVVGVVRPSLSLDYTRSVISSTPVPTSASTPIFASPSWGSSSSSRPAPSWATSTTPTTPTLPAKPTTGKLGIKHMKLLYKTVGDNWACRMCMTRRQEYAMSTSSSDQVRAQVVPTVTSFPKSASWEELLKHCQKEHPKACQDLEKLTAVQIEERKQRMSS